VTPQAKVFDAPSNNKREGLVLIAENERVASFPNIPRYGDRDRSGFRSFHGRKGDVVEGGEAAVRGLQLEELPNLPSTVVGQQEVSNVFI
jgi:hypothetical protein